MTEARDEDQDRFRFKDRDEDGFGDRFRFGQVRGWGLSQCKNTVRRAVQYSRGKYPSYLLLAETACQVLYKYQGSTFADAKSTLRISVPSLCIRVVSGLLLLAKVYLTANLAFYSWCGAILLPSLNRNPLHIKSFVTTAFARTSRVNASQ